MPYRCANDVFGNCDTEPQWEERPKEITLKDEIGSDKESTWLQGGKCQLDCTNCGHYSGIIKPVAGLGKKAVVFTRTDDTRAAIKKKVEEAVKKIEQQHQQSMFDD